MSHVQLIVGLGLDACLFYSIEHTEKFAAR